MIPSRPVGPCQRVSRKAWKTLSRRSASRSRLRVRSVPSTVGDGDHRRQPRRGLGRPRQHADAAAG